MDENRIIVGDRVTVHFHSSHSLFEAAEKAPVYRHSGGAIQWPTDIEEQAILEAALSCRESPESDTVSRGKDDILGERKGK